MVGTLLFCCKLTVPHCKNQLQFFYHVSPVASGVGVLGYSAEKTREWKDLLAKAAVMSK